MNGLAITDHGNLYGAIEFYEACKKGGINPVLGYEAYLAPGDRRDRTAKSGGSGEASSHLTLLAKNEIGFRNLIKLSSAAFLEGFYYKPRIDRELLEAHREGLIVLSGCLAGEFNQHLINDRIKDAEKLAKYFQKHFGEDFYIELQNNGIGLQDHCTPLAADVAKRTGVPLVATADAHYLCAGDSIAHDIYFCINTKRQHDPRRKTYPEEKMPNPYYVRSPADMYELFPQYQDAVARSATIADGVDIRLDFTKRIFPKFDVPRQLTADQYLREVCLEGIAERYGENPSQAVFDRLEIELGVIAHMGYAAYFLIVWDFVRFARQQGIPSTARGSGVGALVSYVLFISHVCPLEYDLLFERFLDKNRKEPPDIDIDFCQNRRELVIQYVKQKYGQDSVAQIGTFGTLAAKAALKDVGRVLSIPLDKVNYMCKLVPMKGAIALSLDDAMGVPDFRKELDKDPTVKHWVEIARKLEGMNRNVGTHAAGVVIASGSITDYVPVQRVARKQEDENGEKKAGEVVVTTQWEMGIVEKVGLLKMDFLGLRNLTVLDEAVKMIRRTRGETIDPAKFPLDDAETYKLLQRGDAKGVFQLESDGIRELLKQMKPDNIRDLIAVLALYRPGPLKSGMVDTYVRRKHGQETWTYEHPVLKDVLEETYGVLVYQEQIMRILNRLGGIELSKSYATIKAISKKVHEKIEEGRKGFLAGAVANGLSEAEAEGIFDNIVHFAEYGFNKSHTTAYAMIGYQTAYLKTHYTAEFMAALLSSEIEDGNKRDVMVDHIADARKLGVDVEPPNANRGRADFDVVDGKIVFGLTAIKGLGRAAAEEIVAVRERGGQFKNLFQFCERVDLRIVKPGQIEKLIKAGGMDCFGKNLRNAHTLALPGAVQAAGDKIDDRKRGQKNMFDLFDSDDDAPTAQGGLRESLPDVPEWPELDKLKFEKEALDFYMSSHPLAQFESSLRLYRSHGAAGVAKLRAGAEVRLAAMVTEIVPKTLVKGRNAGQRWAILRAEDFTGSVKCILWSDQFARFGEDLKLDGIYLFDGKVEWREGSGEPDVIIESVMTLEQARAELTRGLVLRMRCGDGAEGEQVFKSLGSILQRAKGPCPVYLAVQDAAGRLANFKLASSYSINPSAVAIDQLELLLGAGSVVFTSR